jgi:hypothetical protein
MVEGNGRDLAAEEEEEEDDDDAMFRWRGVHAHSSFEFFSRRVLASSPTAGEIWPRGEELRM